MVDDRSTPPIPKSFGLLSLGSSYHFLPHSVHPPSCIFFPPLATPGIIYSHRSTSMLFRLNAMYLSDIHLPSRLITLSEMSLPAGSVVAPPIRNECDANSSRLRRDIATTSLLDRRARPYLTTITELHNRYEAVRA